jgi:hypothetical protein
MEKNVMGGTCSTYEEMTGVYRILVGKPDEMRPLGRPRRRRDDIEMDIMKWDIEGMNGLIWMMIGKGGGHL